MKSILAIGSLSLVLFTSAPVLSAAETHVIDPVHSTVGFEVRHFFTKVGGRFNEFEGKIAFNPEKPAESTVTATIQVASVDTANEKRDEHLRSADFFDAEKNPTITFTSKSIELTGEKQGKVTGDLTLNGVTKEVVLDVEFLGQATGRQGESRTGWEALTKINRKDFGITWSNVVEGTAVVGDDVDIRIQIAAVKEQAE